MRLKRSCLLEIGITMLILLFLWDLWFCALAFPRSTHTGWVSQRLWPFGGVYVNRSAPRATVLRDGEGFQIVFRSSDAEFELRMKDPDWDRDRIATAACWPWPRTSGLFAPVIATYRTEVDVEAVDSSLSASDETLIRAAYLDALERHWVARRVVWPGFLSAARAGEGSAQRISIRWLIHDVVMTGLTVTVMIVLVALVRDAVSPAARARRRAVRNAAELVAGRCPACNYSIAGLAAGADAKCPECGRVLAP